MKDFYLCFPDENLRHGAAEWHAPRLSCRTREIKSTMPPANPPAESWVTAASIPSPIMVGFAINAVVSMPFAKARGLQQRLASSSGIFCFLHVEPRRAGNFQVFLRTTWISQFPAPPRSFANKLLVLALIPQDLYPTSSCLLGLAFLSKQTGLISVLKAKTY